MTEEEIEYTVEASATWGCLALVVAAAVLAVFVGLVLL